MNYNPQNTGFCHIAYIRGINYIDSFHSGETNRRWEVGR